MEDICGGGGGVEGRRVCGDVGVGAEFEIRLSAKKVRGARVGCSAKESRRITRVVNMQG